MPRRKRTHYFNAIYHVILRGNHRQNIFFCDKDRLQMYNYLSEACEIFGCKIHLFCFMTNHVHFVIEIGYIPLAKIMQSINSRYARYINKQQERKGYLCEGRYQAIIVQNEKYLLELCYYIHMNPLKAKITDNLDNYRWSSHCSYCGYENLSWITTELIWNLLKKNSISSQESYLHFMYDRKQSYRETMFCKFDDNGELIIHNPVNLRQRSVAAEVNKRINLPLEKIITIICEQMQISQEQLASGSVRRKIVLARSMIAYFAHYRAGFLLTNIAICLDKRADSISKTMHSTLNQLHSNHKLAQLMNSIERKLILQVQ